MRGDVAKGNASDVVALRHPLFWAALALLVVNDHVLKGAGVLPGWLTGKLSDFAGLLVAPVLLSAILRARARSRRGLAFALVAGWFAAVKLSPAAAALSVALAARVGLSWTIAVDSTDLVALAVLPLAWHVASHRGASSPRTWTERLAIGLGVAACVASPPPEPTWTSAAFFVNRTNTPIELRLRYVDARVDCAAIRDRFAEMLPRDLFAAGTLYVLDPHETLPLDRGIVDAMEVWEPADPTGHVGTCDVVMISIDGVPDTVVYWEGLSPQAVRQLDRDRRLTGGLELVAARAGVELAGGPGYQLADPVDVWEDDGACRDYGRISGFDWSELPAWSGDEVTLTSVREGIDGCMSLVIHDRYGVEHRGYVCVPATDFPFASGNLVRITNSAEELRIDRRLVRSDGSVWSVGELVVHRSAQPLREGPFDVSVVGVEVACEGARMECGGFRVPGAGGITLRDGVRFVNPGETMEREAADGRRARLRVGRAETLLVTRDSCGAGRDVLGPRLEALVVYGEETR